MKVTLLLRHDSEYIESKEKSMCQTKARDEPTFQKTLPIRVLRSRRTEDIERRQKPTNNVKKVRFHSDTFPPVANAPEQVAATFLSSSMSRDELIRMINELETNIAQTKEDYFLEQQLSARKNTILAKISKEVLDRGAYQAARENEIREVLGSIASLGERLAESRAEINNMTNLKMNEYMESLEDNHRKLRTLMTTNEAKVASLMHQQKQETSDARRIIQDSKRKLENFRNQLVVLQDQRMVRQTESSIILERQRSLTELSLEELRNSRRDFRCNLDMIASRYKADIKKLGLQVLAAQLERDMLRDNLEVIKSTWEKSEFTSFQKKRKCETIQSRNYSQFSVLMFTICFGLLILFIAVINSSGWLTMDGLCAPVMPGTTLELESRIYSEAPWWWSLSKQHAFFVCGQRRRTSLSWNRGRLLIIDLETQAPIVDKRIGSVLIKHDSIHIYGKRSRIDAFRSPWTLTKA